MLRRLGRRFYSAKYVFSVHLHSVSPWFAHDKPVKVVWKRGAKKHKRGETSTKLPTRIENNNVNAEALKIEEGFELGVTLYAESNKTKKTGPYGQKDLKMVIMEVDDDGSIFSILGALTINLNEYVGGLEHKMRLPIQCDKEIVNAVGQPYIDITIRCEIGSDSEEPDIVISTGDAHLDPVKPLDVLDPRKSIGNLPIDSVPEHKVKVDGTAGQAEIHTREIPLDETANASTASPVKGETATAPSTIEAEKIHVRDEELMEEEATDAPPAMMNRVPQGDYVLPNAADLISVTRNTRLSTINSEAGEEVIEFMDSSEDALREFIRNELGEDDMANISEVVLADEAAEEKEMNPIDEHIQSETQETEAHTAKESSVASSEIQEPDATTDRDIKVLAPPPTPVVEPLPVSKPTITKPITSTKASTASKPTIKMVSTYDHGRHRRPHSKSKPQPRRGCFWWLPGSNLVCCQPALPREP